MKKLNHIIGFKALLIMLMMFGMAHFASASITFTPPSGLDWHDTTAATCTIGDTLLIYDVGGSHLIGGTPCPQDPIAAGAPDTYIIVECDSTAIGADCSEGTNTTQTIAEADPGYVSTSNFVWNAGGSGGIGEMIDAANTNFQSTTGFPIVSTLADEGVVNWAGDNLIKLFIGSGLALLFGLRFWIVALAIIGAIVYFAFRAFQFFRH